MKKSLFLHILLALFSNVLMANGAPPGNGPARYKWTGGTLDTRIYVNRTATGANTGVSWADAYTDLKTAIAAAQAGDEIWVAEGVYRPDTAGGSPAATFLIDKNLTLYGGFAGTECCLAERNIDLHPTVLSGDLNANDLPGDLAMNRSDNVMTVVTVNAGVTNETLLDGFTIGNGQADGAQPNQQRHGGGIYCLGAPVLRHCFFTLNVAFGSGGGLYATGAGAQGLRVENCRFEQNLATRTDGTGNGGGLYVTNVKGTGISVHNTSFRNNRADWMGGMSVYNSNGAVDSCAFTDNTTPRHGGGMRVFFQNGNNDLQFSVKNSTFENNKASFGGGLYCLLASQNCDLEISGCTFRGNAVEPMLSGWGQNYGGLGFFISTTAAGLSIAVDSCLFEQNTTTVNFSAMGMTSEGKNVDMSLTNSTFRANNNMGFWATAGFWAQNGASLDARIENCLFEGNTSNGSAGLDIGPLSVNDSTNYIVRNCRFFDNHATSLSGALTLWSGTPGASAHFTVEDCLLEGNTAGTHAGGVYIDTNGDGFQATLDRCILRDNGSPWGSAVGAIQFDLNGYVLPSGAQVSIANSLMAGNVGGAAIQLDSFPQLRLLNCTVVDNTGGGIQLSDFSGVVLQNTILHNPGFAEYTAATNNVSAASLGGNLVADNSLNAQLTAADKQGLAPLFVGGGDYRLTAGSPCVDAGIDPGNLPAVDLDGNARVSGTAVDMGAYESGFTPAREVLAGEIRVSPNPAAAFLSLQLLGAFTGAFDVEVFDQAGKLLRRRALDAGQRLDVQELAPGAYTLKILTGERVYVGRFVKQ